MYAIGEKKKRKNLKIDREFLNAVDSIEIPVSGTNISGAILIKEFQNYD